MEKCQNEDFKSCEFIIAKGIMYLPVPKDYSNNWELADILIKRLHKAALHILRENSICDDPLLAHISIEIFAHEHSVCVGRKCLWRQFVDLPNSNNMRNYKFRFHTVRSPTIF